MVEVVIHAMVVKHSARVNVAVIIDSASPPQLGSERRIGRIDGAVATIMALDRAIRCGNGTSASVYDERGILIF